MVGHASGRWADDILACAPLSVRASKQAALQGKSRDFLEGPRAFAEKRKPEWKGR
jgi:enoyl-CoA hydratase/carnithine racemase